MSLNYLCIHGHFYQPPRENPWLEVIENQPSAFPYHDWNERVTRECYGPNTRARLEAAAGRILKLVNNYAYMNFDFGPTLLSWLEKAHPWIYREILAADRISRKRYHGHGNAMAQVYNHIIMPLATTRNKRTQVRWGLADFARRFGHSAEGMWLAETAVDLESLALMAEEGIRFTVLAPTQAEAMRALDDPTGTWKDVSGGNIDTTRPYRVFPRGGISPFIDVFFFDQELSKAVAYEKILASGSDFLGRLEKGIRDKMERACLVNIATDGESYGHHFKFGDMALAWIFDHLEQPNKLELINYACFLERFPPEDEVRILENTSWSCAHGVERWRSDCGCNVNHREGWNQAWRSPLREAMDWLSRELASLFEEEGGKLFRDPWAARDDYIDVMLDPSRENRDRFLEKHLIKAEIDGEQKTAAFELMESQRMALYMYTSCGWFFDDIAGLEAAQILMYADRAMNLARRWSRPGLESTFLSIISRARSNEPGLGYGNDVFDMQVRKKRMPPGRIAANYAFAQLFHQERALEEFLKGRVQPGGKKDEKIRLPGEAAGKILVSDPMTGKNEMIAFSARGREPVDFECRVRAQGGGGETYTFSDISLDTRRIFMKNAAYHIMDQVGRSVSEQDLRALFSVGSPSEETREPLPGGLEDILNIFLRGYLLRLAEKPGAMSDEIAAISELIRYVSAWDCSFQVDDPETRKRGREPINRLMKLIADSAEVGAMTALIEFLDLADAVSLKIDLWECQNNYWDLFTDQGFTGRLSPEQAKAFKTLGERLGFLV